MKTLLTLARFTRPVLIIAIVLALCAFAAREHIDWTWHDEIIWSNYRGHETLQFGLHPNGNVVWRKITHHTNSPSERDDPMWWHNPGPFYQWDMTNFVITNLQVIPMPDLTKP